MFDFMGRRNWFFLLSAVIIGAGLIVLAVFGLRLGIDFTGGSMLEVRLSERAQPAEIKTVYAAAGFPEARVQTTGDATFIVRTRDMASSEKEAIKGALGERFGEVTELRFEVVGPVVGGELTSKAVIAVAAACVMILLYLWWAFRQVSQSYRYGTCAIIALAHDVLVVLGVWAILGRVLGFELDALFVTAILTVVGYSVHDTIVVFDRIRENFGRFPGESFERVVNFSVNQTLDRSLNTSLTVVFTLAALLLLGGVTIREFVLVLLIGTATGTYSSVFTASTTLVVWENGQLARLFRRLTFRPAASQEAGT